MDLMSDTELPGSGSEAVEALIASGALDELFARIDAGEIEMTGSGGLIPELIRAALERGLQAELTDHLGYEKGDPDASFFPNSRNGFTSKTVKSQVGELELSTPRDLHAAAGAEGCSPVGRARRDDHQPLRRRHDDPRH